MKSLFNDLRSAIQCVATLAIALSGAVVMTQVATPFNDPQFKAEIVIALDDGSPATGAHSTQSAGGMNSRGREREAARASANAAARGQKLNGHNIDG